MSDNIARRLCAVIAMDDEAGSESSGGQRLNDSQRATSLAGRTAHEAEEMLKMMEIKHKYKSVKSLFRDISTNLIRICSNSYVLIE